MLFQDMSGGLPGVDSAVNYHAAINSPTFPVTADETRAVIDGTPYRGNTLPGKVVLSPDMEIIASYTGDSDDEGFAAILEHAASR